MGTSRPPDPHPFLDALDAQRAVAGAIVCRGAEGLYEAREAGMLAAHMTLPVGRAVVRAADALDRRGDEINLITLTDEIMRADPGCVPVGSLTVAVCELASHGVRRGAARLVVEAARARATIRRLDDWRRGLASGARLAIVEDEIEEWLALPDETRAPSRNPADDVAEVMATGEAARAGGVVSTGLPGLDRHLTIRPGNLVILGGRATVGKTTLMLTIASHVARTRGPVLVHSLEMDRREIRAKQLAQVTGIAAWKFLLGRTDGDLTPEQVVSAGEDVSRVPLSVQDREHALGGIIAATDRANRRAGGLALVVLDYAQLVDVRTESRVRDRKRYEEVGEVTRRLKLWSHGSGVPVLALSQLRRGEPGARERAPRLDDLRESGNLEQDADAVLLLHRPDPKDRESHVLYLAKNRMGLAGGAPVPLRLLGDESRFVEVAGEEAGEPPGEAGESHVRHVPNWVDGRSRAAGDPRD